MLKQLFKSSPKWQSPKSQRRIEAVGEFQPEQAADMEILTRMAREDSEPAVRREAIKRLCDLDTLAQIQRKDLESSVREAAGLRANEILAGKCRFSPEVDARIDRIRLISSPQVLTYLIKEGQPIEVKIAAVEQLSDEIYLEEIALRSSIARLRQIAAERISNPRILENLAEQSKHSDKSVYRIAKDKLNAFDSMEKSRNETQDKLNNLGEAMETHSRSAFNPLYKAKAESLLQQWQALAAQASPEQAERFETAYDLSQQLVNEHAEAEHRAEQAAQAAEQQLAACEALESALFELQQSPDSYNAPALSALLKTQALRWEVAAELAAADPALSKRYQHDLDQLEKAQNLMDAVQSHKAELETSIETAQAADGQAQQEALPALSSLVEAMPVGKGLPMPSLLKMAYGLLEKQPPEPEQLNIPVAEDPELRRQLDHKITQLEAAIQAGNSHQASKKLRDAQQFTREHHLFDARLGSLMHKIQELKDWEGYAVLPKKQALIQEMEALADKPMDPDEKADTIKLLQDQWKSLGVADHHTETPLWEQFKALSDRAYEPCRVFFNEQREMREQNLAKRRGICDELEQYLGNLPSPLDPRKVDELIRTARKEWQTHYPVERQFAAQVQQRYGKIIKKLSNLLQAEFTKHETAKRELIAEVQGLLASDNTKAACDQAKDAQTRWKAAGHAQAKVDQQLWKEFRAACDALFAKREAEFQARKSAQQVVAGEANELIAALEKLAADASDNKQRAEAEQLRDRFRQLRLPREQHALQQRADKAFKHFEHNLKNAKQRQQDASLQQFIQTFQSLGEAEATLANGGTLDAAALDVGANLQLHEPWQSIAGNRRARITALTENEEARQQWKEGLEARVQQASALSLELEILLDLPSPVSLREARLQRQMELLQKNAFHRNHEQKDEQARSLLKTLLDLPVTDPAAGKALLERVASVLKTGRIRV